MSTTTHWTAQSVDDYVYGISAAFTAQIEAKMEVEGVSRSELAKRLKKSSGRVSQVLNDPGNLSLKTTVEYAKALGMEVSIVAYDGTAGSDVGPIRPDVFVKCWENANRPTDLFEAEAGKSSHDRSFAKMAIYTTTKFGKINDSLGAPTGQTGPIGNVGLYDLAPRFVVPDQCPEIWPSEFKTNLLISPIESQGKWTPQALELPGKGRRSLA